MLLAVGGDVKVSNDVEVLADGRESLLLPLLKISDVLIRELVIAVVRELTLESTEPLLSLPD